MRRGGIYKKFGMLGNKEESKNSRGRENKQENKEQINSDGRKRIVLKKGEIINIIERKRRQTIATDQIKVKIKELRKGKTLELNSPSLNINQWNVKDIQ